MKHFLSTLIFLTIVFTATAQNYRPFRDSLRCEYTFDVNYNNSKYYYDLYSTFDHIETNGDSVFLNRKRCLDYPDYYYFQDWGLGSGMTVKPQPHQYILHLAEGKDYNISTAYVQGGTWDHGSGTATFQSKTLDNILGVQDSVITIVLNNTSNQLIGEIKISKHFGIIKLPEQVINYSGGISPALASIPSLGMGTTIIDLPTLFNYEVGDVLYYIDSTIIGSYYGGPSNPASVKYIKMEILSKTNDADTTFYSYTLKSGTNNFNGTAYSHVLAVSPSKVWIKNETYEYSYYGFFAGLFQYQIPFCSNAMQGLSTDIFTLSDDNGDLLPEMHQATSGEFGPSYEYVYSHTSSGFYRNTYRQFFGSSTEVSFNEIRFLMRFDASQTNPDDIFFTLGVNSASSNALKVYPVPCKEELKISIPEEIHSATLIIRDVTGKIMKQETLYNLSSESVVPVSELQKGTYIIELSNRASVYRQLFIKE